MTQINENQPEIQRHARSAGGEASVAGSHSPASTDLPGGDGGAGPRSDNSTSARDTHAVRGAFLDFAGERYYAIRNVDRMAPFFISVISSSDHWLFVSSTGGLTAGRVSPEKLASHQESS